MSGGLLVLYLLVLGSCATPCSPVTAPGSPATVQECEWSGESVPLVAFADAGSLVMREVDSINCRVSDPPGCLVEIRNGADDLQFEDVTFSGIYCGVYGLFLTSMQWTGILFNRTVVDFAEFGTSAFICTRSEDPQDFRLTLDNSNVTNCHTITGIFECSQGMLAISTSMFRDCGSLEGPAWVEMIPKSNQGLGLSIIRCLFRNERGD
jgi:hypothetical protein